jgi:hypothetical protein
VEPIEKCLSAAIVPSALVDGETGRPSKATLLNVGYLFAAKKIDELCPSASVTPTVQERSMAFRRLESWLLKSLEDHELLIRSQKT